MILGVYNDDAVSAVNRHMQRSGTRAADIFDPDALGAGVLHDAMMWLFHNRVPLE